MATASKTDTGFNHISQAAPEYVEVILWRRVGLVLGALVMTLVGAGWLMYHTLASTADNAELNVATVAPDRLAPAAAIPEALTENNSPAPEEKPAVVDSAATEETDAETVPAAVTTEAATQAPVAAAIVNTADTATPQAGDAAEPATADDAIPARYNVKTEILMPSIRRAVLTDQMRHREPARVLTNTYDLANAERFSLFQFIDIRGQAGETLTYSWKREGKVVAKVRIPVGSDKWRNYSSKNFNRKLLGNWQVDVTDKKGRLLVRTRFYLGN